MTWDEALAVATSLPGAEPGVSYRTPAAKVGNAVLMRLKEDGGAVVLFVSMDEKDHLLEAAPQVFFQTDHYRGWPAILARLEAITEPELRRILESAYRAKAPRRLVAALDAAKPS